MTTDIPHGRWGLWVTEEDISFFRKQFRLHPQEAVEVEGLQGRKLREWYASRWLLRQLVPSSESIACIKDMYGKPIILSSDIQLSVSHSDDYAAVIVSDRSVGIDIQKIVPKISRVAPKFVEDEARGYLSDAGDIHSLHAIWGAKESMYKAYGLRGLDFRLDMRVLPFRFEPEGFYFEGMVHKGDYYRKFTLFCRQINQFILVYAVEVI